MKVRISYCRNVDDYERRQIWWDTQEPKGGGYLTDPHTCPKATVQEIKAFYQEWGTAGWDSSGHEDDPDSFQTTISDNDEGTDINLFNN